MKTIDVIFGAVMSLLFITAVSYADPDVTNLIAKEEGFRSVPYLDTEGYLTIGFGHKLSSSKGLKPADFDIHMTRNVAKKLLEAKVKVIRVNIANGKYSQVFNNLPEDKQNVLISMGYQMGYSGLLGFHGMWEALRRGDYVEAKIEMIDSLWYNQTPERATRHANTMGETEDD